MIEMTYAQFYYLILATVAATGAVFGLIILAGDLLGEGIRSWLRSKRQPMPEEAA
ncbi:MAG: hypothetical protein OXE17_09740 [Chloroflexi bacterium]|nr:hypothetical protein [Chloroflexota bacterium]